MARAAVKAKQKQAAQAAPKTRARGRKRHASGGNPNQQLFFIKMRRSAKPIYVMLAVVFAITFAFLGVGSGTSGGLDQLFSNLNIFKSDNASISAAQKEVQKHPKSAAAYTKLAEAYQAKNQTDSAIGAYQQLTAVQPKNATAWGAMAGLQMSLASTYQQQYAQAYQDQQLAAPSSAFLPTGKLGTALGTNQIEQAASTQASTTTNNLYQKTLQTYQEAVSSYKQLAKLQPNNANTQFQLAQAAQTAGDAVTAVAAYKAYLRINPDTSTAAQIRQLIKQLSPQPVKPKKNSK